MMVYGEGGDEELKLFQLNISYTILSIRGQYFKAFLLVMIIEDYYSNLRKWTPMDVEWAIDGLTNDLLLCKHVQKQSTEIQLPSQNTRLKMKIAMINYS
jgi:hypothetical protein